MGFRTNNYQQINFNDRLNKLTQREQRILQNTWAEAFASHIFPMIDEQKFEVLYCNNNGRPNTPVNVVVGSLILKEMTSVTDEELMEAILFDIRYQYALHLTSCDEIPYSDRTPSRFRERLYQYEMETGKDLLKEEIERLAGESAKIMKISGNIMRMDSLMVSSSCKNMGRLELMYTCVSNCVKTLVKIDQTAILPQELLKYAEDSNKNSVCYRMKKDEVKTGLELVKDDALLLLELCSKIPAASETEAYKLLSRMLNDQTKDGKLKPNKEVSTSSLQNPSDEDATFRIKSGKEYQGYVANVVESCGATGNIIIQYEFDTNLHSDVEFGASVIEKLGKQEEEVVLIGDGAFASDENFKAAEEKNIKLVTTNLTGKIPPEIIADFAIEDHVIKTCPAGHAPIDCKYNKEKEQYRAHFDKDTCEKCPHKEECPVIMQKKAALVCVNEKTIDRAERMKNLSTEEYKDLARKRNGVEGIPSVLRRRYVVDNMPVRGLLRSKMLFGFKIGAINAKKVIKAVIAASCFAFLWKSATEKFLFFNFLIRRHLFAHVA